MVLKSMDFISHLCFKIYFITKLMFLIIILFVWVKQRDCENRRLCFNSVSFALGRGTFWVYLWIIFSKQLYRGVHGMTKTVYFGNRLQDTQKLIMYKCTWNTEYEVPKGPAWNPWGPSWRSPAQEGSPLAQWRKIVDF